ncbi:hypothetical protein BGZ91_011694, partial [Linnemannia elongata]
ATYPAQVVDLTLEQQVLLVSLEGDPQLDLQLGPREPAEIKEVKEVKESTAQETAKDNTKPKSRTGSIGSRSKDALSAISKRFSPPPSLQLLPFNPSPSKYFSIFRHTWVGWFHRRQWVGLSFLSETDGILDWLALQGSLPSPHRLGNHSPPATQSALSFLLHIFVLSLNLVLSNVHSFLPVILRLLLPHGLLHFALQSQAQHE